MKYMLMMNAPRRDGRLGVMKWPAEDLQAHIKFMKNFTKGLADAGELVGGEGLAPPSQARVVRAQAQILALYTLLERMSDNPMVSLNRAIAVAMVHGPAAGLELLDRLAPRPVARPASPSGTTSSASPPVSPTAPPRALRTPRHPRDPPPTTPRRKGPSKR